MERSKIIIVEPDLSEANSLKNSLESKDIHLTYDIKFIEPPFNTKEALVLPKIIDKTIKEINKNKEHVKAVLVDLRILENKNDDTSGLVIASRIKQLNPDIPVINITNYSEGDDVFIFGKSSLSFNDGILPKRLLYHDTFYKNEFDGIIKRAEEKIAMTKSVYSKFSGKEEKKERKKIDIAILTALKEPEFEAIKYFFKSLKKVPENTLFLPDNSHYYQTELHHHKNKLSIIVASDDCMGMTANCSLATRVIQQFNPNYVVLLGICAGIEGKTNIGDIIIASHCWDYGSGKFETDKNTKRTLFRPSPEQEKLDTKVKKTINDFITKKLLGEIKKENDGVYITDKPLSAYVKPFASGSAVIANTDVVDEIKSQHRKLFGFDMEAYGVLYAASNTNDNSVKAISIKGVSDFGTEEKNTEMKMQHQLYASRNSVLFFKKFCYEILLK